MFHHLFGHNKNLNATRTSKQNSRAVTLKLEVLEPRENPAAFYVVPGAAGTSTALDFSWIDRDAAFSNEIGVYKVDDATGAVNGVAPTDSTYAQTALTEAVPVFARGETKGAQHIQTFAAGTVLAFYLAQNTTAANVLSVNPTDALPARNDPSFKVAFFSVTGASPDNFDHAVGSSLGTSTTVRFEDGLFGGDRDFNDAVIRVSPTVPTIVPGATGQTTPTTFHFDQRKAAFHSEVGIYTYDNASGSVNGILPGAPGYAAAALNSSTRQVLFQRTADEGALTSVTLPAAGTFGFYLIQNATSAQFLQLNPNNQPTNGLPVAFFSLTIANPDGTQHVRQSSNTIAFEDGLFGGDRDFNDVVLSFAYGAPMGTATPAPTPTPTPTPTNAPAISAIADQTLTQNTATTALPFTVGSTNTDPANVTVTATSSNPTLVPNTGITLTGTGANRAVTITPAANQSGTAAITLTVNDGTQTATQTFNVTVIPMAVVSFTATNPPNANFNGGAQTVTNFATFTPIPGGATTPTYTVSAVSNPGLFSVLPTVAANGTLSYTPVTGGFGSSTFTLQASDGTNSTTTQTFTIQVDPVQGVTPTTIPNTSISLSDSSWTAISTVVPATNSAGTPAGTVADGTRIQDVVVGTGATVTRGAKVTVAYKGYLLNGTVFDQNTSAQFTASELSLIPGFAAGLIGMQVGGTRRIDISSYLAYGSGTSVGTPNSRLVFEVTVNSIP